MGSKMLIDASHAEETRVVVLRGHRIEEFDFESASRKQLKGNIYLAKVTRVEPSLQAAFVDYGGNRHGFLAFSEIHPDYYQIPIADRQALLREQEEDEAAQAAEEEAEEDLVEQDRKDPDLAEPEEADDAPEDEPSEYGRSAEAHDHGSVQADLEDRLEREQPLRAEAPAQFVSEEILELPETITETVTDESLSPFPALPEANEAPAELSNGVIETVEEDPDANKVDSVGAVDALEEVPQRRRRPPRRQYKIQEVIKRRQIILVQVVKEERGNKGAALTTYLSLAGRYCVLMPNTARGGGISRKITDANDRRRLKEVARDVEIPTGMGLIVRTAGAQRTRPEIKRDFDYLMRLWENVRDLTLSSTAPALVYEEGSLIKRSIRDLYTKDVEEVFVEGEASYREAKEFMKMLMPSHARNVKLYKEARPLFSRHQVETQLDSLFSPTVTLPSGGYIVLNQTEALVSVDINSGKATREHNIEDTALKTNLEACDEIARQLRLRDLAGLVVIDFIDMEEKRNNRAVERRLKDALKHDRARIQVGRISHFGLMEMSRQRLRPGLLEGTSRPCPVCEGRGIVRSISSCGLSVLRTIEDYLQNKRAENITAKCAREVAFYVLNEKRDNLLALEHNYGISVFIVPSDEMKGSQTVIERAGERAIIRRFPMLETKSDSSRLDAREEEGVQSLDEQQGDGEDSLDAEDTGDASEPGQTAGDSASNGRRRRRGRRGSRRGNRPGEERSEATQSSDAHAQSDGEDPSFDSPPLDSPALEVEDNPDSADNRAFEPASVQGEERPRREGGRNGRRRRNDRSGRGGDRDERGARSRPPRDSFPSSGTESHDRSAETVQPPSSQPIAAPVIVEVVSKPVEIRKWQPPTPTVTADPEASPRKTGWWSKRS